MTTFNKLGQWSLGKDGGGNTLMKGINNANPPVSNNKDATSGLKGADVAKLAALQVATNTLPVIGPKVMLQPTNEQLFGACVVTEEMAKTADDKWNNTFSTHFNQLNTKIDHLNKSQVEGSWGIGKSFNSLLSKKELNERNGYVGKE